MKNQFAKLLIFSLVIAFQPTFAQSSKRPAAQLSPQSNAAEQMPNMVLGNIRVVKVEGQDVQLESAGQSSPVREGAFIRQGTTIKTGKDSSVVLLFDNGTTLNIKPESEFAVEKFAQDPFDANGVDYQTLKSEPSSSMTRLNVSEGTIVLDIAKLKNDSSFQIATPVGSAGIRGTSLGITSKKNDQISPVTLAVSTGVVQMKTASGSRAVSGGQSIGISRNGGFSLNPPGGSNLQRAASQSTSAMKQSVPSNPFRGAPPPAPAPAAPGSSLTAAQRQAVQTASEQGNDALVAAVERLVAAAPEAAAEIAAAAADALPSASINVASIAATVAPAAAPQIAANVAEVAPSAAPQIASAVAAIVPSATIQIAQSVASAVPQGASAIATALIAAVPSASAAAIQSATQAGARQSTKPGGGSANQSMNSGDQGSSRAGQILPGSNGGSTGGSGTPPRPVPTPLPTPLPAS
jgi:hypothetical protein